MSFDDFVDTQNVNLRNVTDNVTYSQATQISADFSAELTRRQLTNNQFENLWDLLHGTYEAEVMVTQPQLADLILLIKQTNNQPPTKVWRIIMVSDNNQQVIIEGSAQLGSLRFVDNGEASMTYSIRLDFSSVAVSTI